MPISKLKTLSFLLAIFFNFSLLNSQNLFTPKMEQITKRYVQKKRNKGLVVGIIVDKQFEIRGLGELSKKKSEAPDENTLFELGSITSVYTSTLMVVASQSGQFRLEEAIQEYLPDGIKVPKFHPYLCTEIDLPPRPPDYKIDRIVSCQPHPFAPDKCITFCDLASHTSGLPNAPKGLYSWNPMNFWGQKKDPYEDYTKAEMYENLIKYQLTAAPGAYFKYSNLGMALLGNILSDINELPYSDLLEKTILQPLELRSTKLNLSKTELQQLAPAHNRKGKPTSHWHFKGMAPAGGLKASAADLVRFVNANLNTDNEILADAFEQVHQSRLDLHQRKFGRPTWMGYGWFISTLSESSNLPVIWHSGGTGGFRSFIGFNKDAQIGVVILSNSANSVDEMGFELLDLLSEKTKTN